MTIGNRIKNLRQKRMLNTKELSEALNIDPLKLESIENDEIELDVSLLPKLVEKLKCRMQEILFSSDDLKRATFIPRLLFLYFEFINKEGNVFLAFSFNIHTDEKVSTIRYDFIKENVHHNYIYELDYEDSIKFMDAVDKCQMINWRDSEYGASLCNIYNFYNEKLYVKPEMFRYRCFMDMFKEISNKVLIKEYSEIINDIDINEEMFFHKELIFSDTKKVLEALEKTKEEIKKSKSESDELFWDMNG